ncbi:MAG: fibronectin type III domain-containing protein [Melioribacteraceae bacterium]|nr:fibronectin type III domain-containing protein [Melioribacteraceae bacterium]MCF8355806.1 fibronectin type III domain-containing protein [Melioribacteraceae bacterium]MCF8395296.1 fibronectin type III domain-containing protein [Melioribacteraceae bacterium]MCF8420744.1 fibronectin type III domain-containing protein [Melioribacteraceae bacterium]
MKTKMIKQAILLLPLLFLFSACDEEYFYDDYPPSAPRNVETVTGDERIDIFWDHNYEDDVAGYNVYYSYSYDGRYTLIGNTTENYFVDYGAQNGVTYFYAVAAYDFNNNESELSYDEVFDTPRPEGFNESVYDVNTYEELSGYDFSDYLTVPYNDYYADFFFENYDGIYYLNVWKESDIQDIGRTYDIYDVSVAPTSGWVPLFEGDNVKYVEAVPGHTYVIWTFDNHFAKIRIKNITQERMVFDWAYQTDRGNPELKISPGTESTRTLNLESR